MRLAAIGLVLFVVSCKQQNNIEKKIKDQIETDFLENLGNPSGYEFNKISIVDTTLYHEVLLGIIDRKNERLAVYKSPGDSAFTSEITKFQVSIDSLKNLINNSNPKAINHVLIEYEFLIDDSRDSYYVWIDSTITIRDQMSKSEWEMITN